MKKINLLAIDMGHNVSYDRGAVGIRKEDELNKLVGEALISKCRVAEINVVNCTPSSAISLSDSLNKRVVAANKAGADFFISIHHNACPGGYGTEILCIKDGQQNELSERVASVILPEICKLGFRNRGVKDRRDLYVINQTTMPAILIECAFVDSSSDMNGYNTEKIAEAIFSGICKAFGIKINNLNIGNSGYDPGLDPGLALGHINSNFYHTVIIGDTLWGISKKYGATVDKLVDINGIKDKNLIRVGDKIRVR